MPDSETTDDSRSRDASPQPPAGVPQSALQSVQQDSAAPQQAEPPNPDPKPKQPLQPEEERSAFGPNGRWLWFSGGLLFIALGVLLAALFNLNKPAAQRNDAIKWALIGMAIGFVINLIVLFTMGGFELLAGSGTSSSSGSIF